MFKAVRMKIFIYKMLLQDHVHTMKVLSHASRMRLRDCALANGKACSAERLRFIGCYIMICQRGTACSSGRSCRLSRREKRTAGVVLVAVVVVAVVIAVVAVVIAAVGLVVVAAAVVGGGLVVVIVLVVDDEMVMLRVSHWKCTCSKALPICWSTCYCTRRRSSHAHAPPRARAVRSTTTLLFFRLLLAFFPLCFLV